MTNTLDRLRFRLTMWYIVTFGAILILLGFGMFMAIERQFAAQLDDSLKDATTELQQAARIREQEKGASGKVVDALDELRIPDRFLYLMNANGTPIKPDTASRWLQEVARKAALAGPATHGHRIAPEVIMRYHAEPFLLQNGDARVAIAAADEIELEDKYAWLIAAFGVAALFALALVSGGGWFLMRKSTQPIAASIEHMRRFMADASHELRTPLTVIRNRSEIALRKSREANAYESALRAINAETERLGRIVDDLLTLSRADSGDRPMQKRNVYLDDIALDAATTARTLADSRGISLSVEQFEEAKAFGDPVFLRQLIMILLDNAIKYTPSGGRVKIRVAQDDRAAILTVDDTGPGIPQDKLPHIFERFFRADPSRTRDGQDGAGLGLSIAQWIAKANDATIDVESSVGQGTRVTVRFPAQNGANAAV